MSRSPSPDFSPLAIGEDLTPLPDYKAPSTRSISFSNLLDPPLLLHEDLKSGCGGQLWPAGTILAKHMLRYHPTSLKNARMHVSPSDHHLELGAGGGLVGLAVAIGCHVDRDILITDQAIMLPLMAQNVKLNGLEEKVTPQVLNWGEPLPEEVLQQKPNVILAADCVYFEPAFPLLLKTLEDLFKLSEHAIVYFCFKKRRRADLQFIKNARKAFIVAEPEDEDRITFSREGLFMYSFTRKC